MQIRDGSPINISANHGYHNHEPALRYAVSHCNIINRLRERAISFILSYKYLLKYIDYLKQKWI